LVRGAGRYGLCDLSRDLRPLLPVENPYVVSAPPQVGDDVVRDPTLVVRAYHDLHGFRLPDPVRSPREDDALSTRLVCMFPANQTHQEIVRQRHAHFLREARREHLAAVATADRERSPIVRLGRSVGGLLLDLLWRREAHARRPARRAV
jgi:hypothetical protein